MNIHIWSSTTPETQASYGWDNSASRSRLDAEPFSVTYRNASVTTVGGSANISTILPRLSASAGNWLDFHSM